MGLIAHSELRQKYLFPSVYDTKYIINVTRWRIFGLSSPAEPSSLDVGENVSDDLPKVGSAQRTVLQVVTVSPRGQKGQRRSEFILLELQEAACVTFLTCRSRRRPVWADRCPNAPPGDCGSSYRCEAGRLCWMSLSHHHYTHRVQISRKHSGPRVKLLELKPPEGLTSCLRRWVQTAAAGTGTACHCLRNAELLAVKAEQTTHEHWHTSCGRLTQMSFNCTSNWFLPESDPLWFEHSFCKTESTNSTNVYCL